MTAEKVVVCYNHFNPKKHLVRMSTNQIDPGSKKPFGDIYIPNSVLDEIGWDYRQPVYVTYSLVSNGKG